MHEEIKHHIAKEALKRGEDCDDCIEKLAEGWGVNPEIVKMRSHNRTLVDHGKMQHYR